MNLPKEFNEYAKRGIIRRCSVNRSRAEFLVSEVEKALRGLDKRVGVMGIDEDNANSLIKDCYDIIMELIRAKLLLSGYCSAGQFAHEAEISYLREQKFLDNDLFFINNLRFFRNSLRENIKCRVCPAGS